MLIVEQWEKLIKDLNDTEITEQLDVKITEGGLKFYLPLSFLFYFLFHFRSIFLFLELEIGLSDKDHTVTWQVTSEDMVTSHMT